MPVVLLLPEETTILAAAKAAMVADGWHIADDPTSIVDAVIFDAGLPDGEIRPDAAAALITGARKWNLRAREDGGARVVAVGSRDQLGSAQRAESAAAAGALASAVRSLALELGPRQVSVNLVAPNNPSAGDVKSLLPQPVSVNDIAATAAFLADPRSKYITGQILFCCAGSSLLSSLSV
jgi:NAD(P)-dependent dehydrogenase (short-subunit alcohol dehydrogenase family)